MTIYLELVHNTNKFALVQLTGAAAYDRKIAQRKDDNVTHKVSTNK